MQGILPMQIHVDNQGAMLMANYMISNHIYLIYYMIHDHNNNCIIKLNYTRPIHNIAGIMTNTPDKVKHRYFTRLKTKRPSMTKSD